MKWSNKCFPSNQRISKWTSNSPDTIKVNRKAKFKRVPINRLYYRFLLCLWIKSKTIARPKTEVIKTGTFELISHFLFIQWPNWIIKYITEPIWKASPEKISQFLGCFFTSFFYLGDKLYISLFSIFIHWTRGVEGCTRFNNKFSSNNFPLDIAGRSEI